MEQILRIKRNSQSIEDSEAFNNIGVPLDFEIIFETYYARVYNYNYYRTHNKAVAEDLTSLVFEKIMLKIDSYAKQKAKFEVWLFTIARNTLNDYFRRQKRFIWDSLDNVFEMVAKEDGPEETLLKAEQNRELMKQVALLKDKERAIIAYKFGAGLKNKEIAEIMHINEKHLSVMICRILKKLKCKMEEEHNDER